MVGLTDSPLPFPESLCHRCAAPPRYLRTAASLFIRCPLVAEKYPRQPMSSCEQFRPAVIATERLVLRELVPEDEPFVASMTESVPDAAKWLERCFSRYRRDGFGFWLALERESGSPVGQIGLLAQEIEGRREVEVSYHLHADYRRLGYAVEGARAVLAWAFERGHASVFALIRDDNAPSQAVARRLAMTPGVAVAHASLPHRLWRIDASGGARPAAARRRKR
jgi:RimJ/RimL family protein N-acetyltransferase